jgi:signal transduction histidine kinase
VPYRDMQIGELLDHARAQDGRPLELSLKSIDVVDLVRRAVDEHQRTTAQHMLTLHAPANTILATVDARRLERAVANLVVNAIKYSPRGGPIVVSVGQDDEPDGQSVSITVTDHGLGIPGADLPHMFEQYYRGSNVASDIPGTGIGLAGVRHMVQSHGGTISITSREGEGTTVTMRLPRQHPDAPPAEATNAT